MIDEIFEVSKQEYKTLLAELKPEYYEKTVKNLDDKFEIHFYSKDGTRHFAACIGDNNGIKYYIIDLPYPNERGKTPIVKQVVLNDEESVKELFTAIAQSIKKE